MSSVSSLIHDQLDRIRTRRQERQLQHVLDELAETNYTARNDLIALRDRQTG